MLDMHWTRTSVILVSVSLAFPVPIYIQLAISVAQQIFFCFWLLHRDVHFILRVSRVLRRPFCVQIETPSEV